MDESLKKSTVSPANFTPSVDFEDTKQSPRVEPVET